MAKLRWSILIVVVTGLCAFAGSRSWNRSHHMTKEIADQLSALDVAVRPECMYFSIGCPPAQAVAVIKLLAQVSDPMAIEFDDCELDNNEFCAELSKLHNITNVTILVMNFPDMEPGEQVDHYLQKQKEITESRLAKARICQPTAEVTTTYPHP